jgi:hypothetical protein
LILFSLLDSHTTASSFSNIRLDNFVYTEEAIARTRQLLNPDGLMVLKFQANSVWIAARLSALLQHVFHSLPFELSVQSRYGRGGTFYVIGSPNAMSRLAQDSSLPKRSQMAPSMQVTVTTDDWPYFYQKERGVPGAILGMSGFLICFSWYLVRRLLGGGQQEIRKAWRVHFLLLGAGFMLLEAQIISKMALLFGTTWVVNSIVVSGLLLLIVAANLIFERWRTYPLALPYAGIIVSAMLAYFIPLRVLLFENLGMRVMVATLLLCLPVLFAGMVFIRSFADVRFSGAALGWNLIGAVLGGMLETVSQATGMRSLVLITIGLYVGSWIARRKVDNNDAEATPLLRNEELVGTEI